MSHPWKCRIILLRTVWQWIYWSTKKCRYVRGEHINQKICICSELLRTQIKAAVMMDVICHIKPLKVPLWSFSPSKRSNITGRKNVWPGLIGAENFCSCPFSRLRFCSVTTALTLNPSLFLLNYQAPLFRHQLLFCHVSISLPLYLFFIELDDFFYIQTNWAPPTDVTSLTIESKDEGFLFFGLFDFELFHECLLLFDHHSFM